MVSSSWCPVILTPTQSYIQFASTAIFYSHTIKIQLYYPCTQGRASSDLFPLQAYFHRSNSCQTYGKNSYQGLHLSSCILITVTCFKTGSPFVLLATVALIYLLHTLIELLQTHDCVHVIALDFSKAFDSVRHHSLVSKLATARLSWQLDSLLPFRSAASDKARWHGLSDAAY